MSEKCRSSILIFKTDTYKHVKGYNYFWTIRFYGNGEYVVQTSESGIEFGKPGAICKTYDEALNTLYEFMKEKMEYFG